MQCDYEYESQGVKVICPFSALPGGTRCVGHMPQLRAAQEAAVREHQWAHKEPILAVAQMAKAPGKMIARSDIIAILRAQRGISGSVVDAEYDRLISIFSNVE